MGVEAPSSEMRQLVVGVIFMGSIWIIVDLRITGWRYEVSS